MIFVIDNTRGIWWRWAADAPGLVIRGKMLSFHLSSTSLGVSETPNGTVPCSRIKRTVRYCQRTPQWMLGRTPFGHRPFHVHGPGIPIRCEGWTSDGGLTFRGMQDARGLDDRSSRVRSCSNSSGQDVPRLCPENGEKFILQILD